MSKILTDIYLFKTAENIIKYTALWDTGATETLISKKVVAYLGLDCAGEVEVCTINGSQIVNRYFIGLLLENHNQSINMAPAEFSHRKECDVIIGMDIISNGKFIFDKGNFTFTIESLL